MIQYHTKTNELLPEKKKFNGHTKSQAPYCSLECDYARLRVSNLQYLFRVSHSTLYKGIGTGRYPKADGKDGRMPYWLCKTIREFLKR